MTELASSEREIILYYNPDRPSASKTLGYAKNKKGGIASTFFAPNLTMNLTYLCYGRY